MLVFGVLCMASLNRFSCYGTIEIIMVGGSCMVAQWFTFISLSCTAPLSLCKGRFTSSAADDDDDDEW